MNAKLRSLVLGSLGLLFALAVWEVMGRRLGDGLVAPPSRVVIDLFAFLRDQAALDAIFSSIIPMLVGFALSCIVGMPAGVAMGRSKTIFAVLDPWVSLFVVTSVAAIVPILMMLIGNAFWFQVSVVVVSSIWFIVLTMQSGSKRIDRRWLDVGRSFGASDLRSFFTIMLPALFPYMLAAARIGLIHAIRSMILAQLFIVTGVGGLLHYAGMEISTARLMSVMLVIVFLGLLANFGLTMVARLTAPWHDRIRERDVHT